MNLNYPVELSHESLRLMALDQLVRDLFGYSYEGGAPVEDAHLRLLEHGIRVTGRW